MKFPFFLKKGVKKIVGDVCFLKLQDIKCRLTGGLGNNLHNNILLEKKKAIFFPIPKVACTSIKKVCSEILGFEDKKIHLYDFPYVKRYELDNYKSYYKFAFVRNPWDRIVSCYLNKISKPINNLKKPAGTSFAGFGHPGKFYYDMAFEKFIDVICSIPDDIADPHFRSQYTFICDSKNNLIVNFVGRFESLKDDFSQVLKTINEKDKELEFLNNTPGKKDYRLYFNEKTRSMIERRYATDISLFKYHF